MLLRLTVASLSLALAFAPVAASAQGVDWYGRYWSCSYRVGLGEGQGALSGEYSKSFNLEGTYSHSGYRAWGQGLRVQWRMTQTGRELTDLSVEMRSVREPTGVYGYLYGNEVLVSKSKLLDPAQYRIGFSSGAFSPYAKDVAALDSYDRWTVVTRTGEGVEIERRALPVPDRRGRDQAFAGYQAVIAAAWKARDEKLLETASSSALPPAPAHCLLSTPETRAEIEAALVIEEPLQVLPRPRP